MVSCIEEQFKNLVMVRVPMGKPKTMKFTEQDFPASFLLQPAEPIRIRLFGVMRPLRGGWRGAKGGGAATEGETGEITLSWRQKHNSVSRKLKQSTS